MSGYTAIRNATELAAIKSGMEYELAGDIHLTPDWRTLEGLTGISLHGNGHVVRGLLSPLFGELAQSKIMHTRVEAAITRDMERYTGAFVRTGLRITLSGCSVAGSIQGAEYVGGLAGYLSQSTLTNCVNIATVSGEQYVGGLAGCASHSSVTANTNSGQLKAVGRAMYGGGVVGYAQDESYLADNVNTGPLVGYAFHGLGGIAGGVRDIRVCSGNVNKGMLQGRRFVGGIAGMADVSAVEYNQNLAPVNCSMDHAGGIIGYAFMPPLLIRGNVAAGAVEGERDSVGGVCGFAAEGSMIVDNVVSCPSVKGRGNIGRVLGNGGAYLSNSRVNAQCMLRGLLPTHSNAVEAMIEPNNPDYGLNGKHGESFVCPQGMEATGIWMNCAPASGDKDAGSGQLSLSDLTNSIVKGNNRNARNAQSSSEVQSASGIEAGVNVLSQSFIQIVTSLGLGITALSTLFQTELELLSPMLAREREALNTLRLLQSTLNSYMEYCDSVDPGNQDGQTAIAEGKAVEPSPAVTAKVNRIIIKLTTATTQMPLEGVPFSVTSAQAVVGFRRVYYSDAEGQVIIDGLPVGAYDVKEDAAPFLFTRDSETNHLTVSDDDAYDWKGRHGLRWDNQLLVTIPHERDDSALFLHGQEWAARPDKLLDDTAAPYYPKRQNEKLLEPV